MGVDVVLVVATNPGTGPRRRRVRPVAVFLDETGGFADLCRESGSAMLQRVDPYRTLILTSSEMEQFVAEIEAAKSHSDEGTKRAILTEIANLAVRCAQDCRTELHLEGD